MIVGDPLSRNADGIVIGEETIVVQRTSFETEERLRGPDARPGGRGSSFDGTRFSHHLSHRAGAARLPRSGEEGLNPRSLAASLTKRTETRDVAKKNRSRRAKREAKGVAGSALAAALRERFGLTRMESIVACALADGLTYAEIEDRCSISYHTVHTHVKAIHAKANVKSNGRLLALIRDMGRD